jgi:tyrosine-protein phosphatase SIW14
VYRAVTDLRRTMLATTLFAGLAGFVFAGQAAAPAQEPVSRSVRYEHGKKEIVPGVGNFGEVTPLLYRGAQPNKQGYAELKKMGIDIVVDLRRKNKKEKETLTKLGMIYEPMSWFCMRPKDPLMARFLRLIRDNPGKKIFVHCTTGIDRTGMMVAAYRMADQGWSAQEAMAEMKEFGFSRFHQTICWGLGSYEAKFPHEFATNPVFKDLPEDKEQKVPAGGGSPN